ncbi:hypothetical protein [Actinoplanes sp. NPDC026619]|uniref:hypothetical protein n=1 Tax=Actinoplanes sp. NPDC026619 TaxID=3155798 RepID=UPI0033C65CEE
MRPSVRPAANRSQAGGTCISLITWATAVVGRAYGHRPAVMMTIAAAKCCAPALSRWSVAGLDGTRVRLSGDTGRVSWCRSTPHRWT